MENHASSTGKFGLPSDYHKVTIETHPWQKGFVTDVYVEHFQSGREVSSRHEEFFSKDPIEAHNIHVQAEQGARSLGSGYFTGFNHFGLETTIEEPLEITIDKDNKPQAQPKEKIQADRPDSKAPEEEGKKAEDPKPNPEKKPDTRVESPQPQTEKPTVESDNTQKGQVGQAVIKGSAAGGLEFLAETSEFAPYFLMFTGMFTGAGPWLGLRLAPYYSFVAEGLHNTASDELYEATQQNETAARVASGVGYFGSQVLSNIVGPKGASFLKNFAGKESAAAFGAIKNIMRAALISPPRGYFVLPSPSLSRCTLTKIEKKLGMKAADLIYNDKDFFIASDKFLKNAKRGQRTGLDSNHLVLAEWFKKGPKHLRGLEDFVPSYLLGGGMEHQGTFHGAANQFLKGKGLFQQPSYTQKQIEQGMKQLEKYYKNNPGGDLGNAWANAIEEFRINIFGKVK